MQSQKLFPCVKMVKEHEDDPYIHLPGKFELGAGPMVQLIGLFLIVLFLKNDSDR